jgi:nicotinate-nucleotide pyrophosphorylase
MSLCFQVTSLSTIPANLMANARFLAKDDGVISGLAVAEQVLKTVSIGYLLRRLIN